MYGGGGQESELDVIDELQALAFTLASTSVEAAPEQRFDRLRRLSYAHSLISLALADEAAQVTLGQWEEEGSVSRLDGIRRTCKLGYGQASDLLATGCAAVVTGESRQALLEGRIGFGHLALIAHAAHSVSRGGGSFDERPYLKEAKRESVNAFRYTARSLRIKQSPDGALRELQDQHQFRFLTLHDCHDGSLALRGHFTAADGQLLRSALEPLARTSDAEDERSREQRCADALTEACALALGSGSIPRLGGVRPHVLVSAELDTILGRSEAPGRDLISGEPVHPRTVERLVCDSSLSRILFDSEGVVIDAGRERRVVSPSQRRAIHARDQTCRFGGCHRPASQTEVHHLVAFRDGGTTDGENCVSLCNRHHFLVHEGGWRLMRGEDGQLVAIPPAPRVAEMPGWGELFPDEDVPRIVLPPTGTDPPY